MKKIGFLTVIVMMTALIASSKKTNHPGNEKKHYQTLQSFRKSLPDGEKITWHVSIPSGATTEVDGNTLKLTMPEGVEIYGLAKRSDQFERLSATGYTCSCESKDGKCTPFVAGNQVGCVTNQEGPCSKCVGTKANSLELFSDFSKVYYVHHSENDVMAGLAGFAEIVPVSSPEQIEKLPPVTEEILSSPEVEKELKTIKEHYQYNAESDFTGGKVPDGYSLIPVMIREHLAYLVIPSDKVESGMIELAIFNFEGESASSVTCTGCGSSCKLKTKNLGLVKYCDGCLSGCTIHF